MRDVAGRLGPYGTNLSVSVMTAAEQEEQEERQLQGARDSFPGWQIREVFGGFLALPKGTVTVHSTTLDGLVMKLRQQQD